MRWFLPLTSLFSLFSALNADTECPAVPKIPEDRRTNKTTLTIMQYNVEWLFIDYYASANCPGNGCDWKNSSEANTHLQYVSNVIQKLNPDIINLCEVEGCDELNLLLESINSKIESKYLPYLKKGTDTSTGQNVGLLTRVDPLVDLYRSEDRADYPISGSKCGYTGSAGSSGVSKHHITEYNFEGHDVAFIGAHLLAIPTDPTRCAEREAQAQVLQDVIYGYIKKGYEIIFMGDLNDYDSEVLDINDSKPLSRVLDILKGLDGINKGTYQLFNAAELISKNERYTDWWDSNANCITTLDNFSMIDHILLSPSLKEKIASFSIYHGYEEYCHTYNSDHYPLIIEFKF